MPHHLSSKDYHTLLETIELAYSIPDRATLLSAIFKKIEKWIGISGGAFLPINLKTGEFPFEGAVTYNCDAGAALCFFAYYAPLHPLVERKLHLTAINEPLRLTDFVPASALPNTEYGKDFQPMAQIFYELSMPLGSQGNPIAGLVFHREKHERDFADRDIAIMNLLLPHLSQALHNISLIETIVSSQDIGLIIIGSDNMPLFMNDLAKQALNGRPVSMIPDPGLSPNPTYFQSECGTYRVQTKTSRPGIKERVIFLEPVPTQSHLKTKLTGFGLTPRQEEIAALVIRGFSNREIAEKLFISDQTVKDHLYDIFEKIQVRRRSELVARVLGLRTEDH